LIVLGSGNKEIENNVRDLEKKFPDRVRAVIKYDPIMAKRMYAGGDMLLIPSRYEPCGLTQMIAMLYGCVPVATATGGLKDTIINYPEKNSTGFLSSANTKKAFTETLQRALSAFENQDEWCKIQKRGMKKDFSWKKSAAAYTNLYLHLMGEK
jgi:starch synthase